MVDLDTGVLDDLQTVEAREGNGGHAAAAGCGGCDHQDHAPGWPTTTSMCSPRDTVAPPLLGLGQSELFVCSPSHLAAA